MSALFDFNSFVVVVLLTICACTYVKLIYPAALTVKTGFKGLFWKAARIGERLSPWVGIGCIVMAVVTLLY